MNIRSFTLEENPVELACGLTSSAEHVGFAVEAERLGYHRVWFTDSPAFYEDVWMMLALAAKQTTTIGLGPAVLVPSLRHVLATAAAVATLESLAPGRTSIAIGTGFSGRMALGQPPMAWKRVEQYLTDLRALLNGETVVVEGKPIRMLQSAGYGATRPIVAPVLVAANGPKGLSVAEGHADGVLGLLPPPGSGGRSVVAVLGTVLEPGEDHTSDRVLAAAGPAAAAYVHGLYEQSSAVVRELIDGDHWCDAIEQGPEDERHLRVHEGHVVELTDRDQDLLRANPDLIAKVTFTGTHNALTDRLKQLSAAGVDEVVFFPAGDIQRELESFAKLF